MSLLGYYVESFRKIRTNRGAPRLWLEGKRLFKSGFKPGQKYQVSVKDTTLTLQVKPTGERIVSCKKKKDGELPIIDINSKELLDMFDGFEQVRVVYQDGAIHILPMASELRVRERLSRLKEKILKKLPLKTASLAFGGGILSCAAHKGLEESGVDASLGFACEIRGKLLDHAEQTNDAWSKDTVAIGAPLQEFAFDEWAMSHAPKADILEVGIPCSGASRAGKAKRGLSHPEEHPDVGHLVAGALAIIAKVNPAIVVIENVEDYSRSASGFIFRNQLRDLGYEIQETILDGADFNVLEHRKRWSLVAVTKGVPFDLAQLEKPAPQEMRLADIFEPIADNDPRWSRMQGLKDKEKRDKAAGKGFAMQIFTGEESSIKTLTKGYAKVRSTDPKIAHPTDPDLLRQLTAIEHARCKGIPEHLIEGLSNTIAHEVLGQSVLFAPFASLFKLIGKSVKSWAESLGSSEMVIQPTLFKAAA